MVVIIGRDTTPAAENRLYQELHSMRRNENYPSLRTDLIRGGATFLTSAIGLSYDRQPTIGSSLGVRDVNWATGFLGGFIKLRNWMSRYHVL